MKPDIKGKGFAHINDNGLGGAFGPSQGLLDKTVSGGHFLPEGHLNNSYGLMITHPYLHHQPWCFTALFEKR
jgi:hypothetical protein